MNFSSIKAVGRGKDSLVESLKDLKKKLMFFSQDRRWLWEAVVKGAARGSASTLMKYAFNWLLEFIVNK